MRARYLWLVILLAGCGGEEFQDLQEFVKTAGADMRGKIDAPPEVKPYEPFIYDNSTKLTDPFRPRKPETHQAGHGVNPAQGHRKEELEEFPLEALKMVGYLYMDKVGYAVISAPDGKLHQVRAGNYIGQNFGQITSITETEIKLKEMVQDSGGDWSERISSLQLME